jgi:hypothetical protein
VFSLASLLKLDCHSPNLVLVGVPDVCALERVRAKARAAGVAHYAWEEPDYEFGFTALATAPLDGEQRKVFAHYRVWRDTAGAASNRLGGSRLTPLPDSPVVSTAERSVLT